jgi:Fuc2NAc and GlcNAc transferase
VRPVVPLVVAGAFVIAVLLTTMVRRVAVTRALLDVPNARSSHDVPTPKSGGLAIVMASLCSAGALYAFGVVDLGLLCALSGGGLAVAVIGFADDRRPLPPAARLLVHVAAAIWALQMLGGLPPLWMGAHIVSTSSLGYAIGALGIVWVVNLFNFMDGIDGLAASEAAFVALAGAVLAGQGGSLAATSVALAFAAACCGFLVFNWPPASIFMGDVGSGYLGYMVGVLAVAIARSDPVALWAWLVLGGVFFVDATVTLLRRLFRGERVYQAHRCHGYQWLARRWRSHRAVTIAVMVVNLGWLLPCALWIERRPHSAPWIALIALAPLLGLALVAGSGKSESV